MTESIDRRDFFISFNIADLAYATWQDPSGDKRKLIPILIRDTTIPPLMAMLMAQRDWRRASPACHLQPSRRQPT
jgi:hypothetical protein